MVSAARAVGHNPFPPDFRDETLTGDVVELATAEGCGVEIDSERARAGLVLAVVVGLARARRDHVRRHPGAEREHGADVVGRLLDFVRAEPAGRAGTARRLDLYRTRGRRIDRQAGSESRRGWELVSENPAVAPEPWPADAEVVGEVVWVAQTLVGPRRR